MRQARRERELLEEISTLKTAMLTIKEKYQQNKEELYKQLLQEKERAHQAEILQLQSRAQLEQLQQAKTAADERATAAETAAAQERQRADDEKNKAEADAKAAAKERAAEKKEAAEKLAEVKSKYSKVAEDNYHLKAALQQERQKSWLDKLLGR